MSARRHPSRAARGLGGAALVIVLAAGCVTMLPPPREPIPEDARRTIEQLRAAWDAFEDLRTVADITLERGGRRQRLTGVLLVQRPGSMRFEALSPFGQPFLFVLVHDGKLLSYDASTNDATTAPATAETSARLIGLPFEPGDLVAALAGFAVPPGDLRAAERLPADDAGPSLLLHGAVNRKRVWFDAASGVVRRQEIVGGRYEVRATYERGTDGVVTRIAISAAQSQITGDLRYRNTVVDGGIDPERFTFRLPNGAKIHTIR